MRAFNIRNSEHLAELWRLAKVGCMLYYKNKIGELMPSYANSNVHDYSDWQYALNFDFIYYIIENDLGI